MFLKYLPFHCPVVLLGKAEQLGLCKNTLLCDITLNNHDIRPHVLVISKAIALLGNWASLFPPKDLKDSDIRKMIIVPNRYTLNMTLPRLAECHQHWLSPWCISAKESIFR